MDKYEIRRQRLIWLRDNRCEGANVDLARRIGKDASYVGRMLYPDGKAGKKRIAEDMADTIESAFSLRKGWLSEPGVITFVSAQPQHPNIQRVVELMGEMDDAGKAAVLGAAIAIHGQFLQAKAENKNGTSY